MAGCAPDESSSSDQQATLPDSTGAGAPIIERADFALENYQDSTGQEGVVLLNFWATWCAPCRAEIPDLIRLQDSLGTEGLRIVGVAMDMNGGEAVRPFVGKRPINYPIVIDAEGEIAEQFGGVRALPTTLFINSSGMVVKRNLGLLRLEEAQPYLKSMLTGTASDSAKAHDV